MHESPFWSEGTMWSPLFSSQKAYHCCRKEIGERHNVPAWNWQKQCEEAGWRPQNEQAALVWHDGVLTHNRADVYIVSPQFQLAR